MFNLAWLLGFSFFIPMIFFSCIYNIIEPQETSFLTWKCHNYELHLT